MFRIQSGMRIVWLFLVILSVRAISAQWSEPIELIDSLSSDSKIKPCIFGDSLIIIHEKDYNGSQKYISYKNYFSGKEYILIAALGATYSNPVSHCFPAFPNNNLDQILVGVKQVIGSDTSLTSLFYTKDGSESLFVYIDSAISGLGEIDLSENKIIWEKNGCIYFSEFNLSIKEWSKSIAIDSMSCSCPIISSEAAAYIKNNNIYISNYDYQNKEWILRDSICEVGNVSNLSFSESNRDYLLWESQFDDSLSAIWYYNLYDKNALILKDSISGTRVWPQLISIPCIASGSSATDAFCGFSLCYTEFHGDTTSVMFERNGDDSSLIALFSDEFESIKPKFVLESANDKIWVIWESDQVGYKSIKGIYRPISQSGGVFDYEIKLSGILHIEIETPLYSNGELVIEGDLCNNELNIAVYSISTGNIVLDKTIMFNGFYSISLDQYDPVPGVYLVNVSGTSINTNKIVTIINN